MGPVGIQDSQIQDSYFNYAKLPFSAAVSIYGLETTRPRDLSDADSGGFWFIRTLAVSYID